MIQPRDVQQAATSPLTSPQIGLLNRVLGLSTGQAETALQRMPEQLAQSQAMLEGYTPGQPIDPKLLDQFMNLTGFAPMGITSWHGSPYLFRQFDPTKVGAGEGAQAYGVGAGYTAEARPVAEGYRNALAGKEQDIINNAISRVVNISNKDTTKIKDSLILEGFPKEKITPELEKSIGKIVQGTDPKDGSISSSAIKEYDVLKKLVPGTGYLYKGDIPDEILPKFLDWDKPLSQQTKEVQDAIGKDLIESVAKEVGVPADKLTGGQFYTRNYRADTNLMPKGIDKSAEQMESDWLQSRGIAGIRYLDQGSRGAGKGTSNFVPFRPEDFKIQEINDIPLEDWIKQGLL